jgi:hypothetical protein
VWYVFQLIVWWTIVYKYVTVIAPHERVGAIMLFATLLTFLATWVLSKLLDMSRRLIRFTHIKLVKRSQIKSLRVATTNSLLRWERKK